MDTARHRRSLVRAGARGPWLKRWTRRQRWRLGVVLLAAAAAVLVTVVVAGIDGRSPADESGAATSGRSRSDPTAGPRSRPSTSVSQRPATPAYVERPPKPTMRWTTVMGGLDAVRERAWGRGRPELLSQVYVAGSPLLARDRAMMRAYTDRGLRVAGASLKMSRVSVVARRPGVVRLAMVDELGPLVALATDGGRQSLPDDLPSRHLVELRREDGRWQIAAVWLR